MEVVIEIDYGVKRVDDDRLACVRDRSGILFWSRGEKKDTVESPTQNERSEGLGHAQISLFRIMLFIIRLISA